MVNLCCALRNSTCPEICHETMDGTGYADGVDRPYQLTLGVENNTWKITKIDICLTDGCLDMTSAIVP